MFYFIIFDHMHLYYHYIIIHFENKGQQVIGKGLFGIFALKSQLKFLLTMFTAITEK